MKKIRKSDYLTMQVIAERLKCRPTALAIVRAITKLQRSATPKTAQRLPEQEK